MGFREKVLVMEFDQLRKVRRKMSTNTFMLIVKDLVLYSGNPLYNCDMEYRSQRKKILDLVTGGCSALCVGTILFYVDKLESFKYHLKHSNVLNDVLHTF